MCRQAVAVTKGLNEEGRSGNPGLRMGNLRLDFHTFKKEFLNFLRAIFYFNLCLIYNIALV